MQKRMARPGVVIETTVEDRHTNILPKRQVLLIITGLAVSLLISYVDQNSIAVILPQIGKDLDSMETIQWAGTSSLIANTVFQVFYGRVSDIFGRNIVLFASLAFLAAGDLACALARTGPQFYVFRAIAGVGNGGINALAMIIVSDIVTLEDRGKCVGPLHTRRRRRRLTSV
jgi:MFS family permease